MKSLTFKELDLMVEMAESFEGFYVQEVIISHDMLVLYMRLGPKEAYLIADVGSQKPLFIATQQPLPPFKKQTKPIVLFLRKYLIGKKLAQASRQMDYGRLVNLKFKNDEGWLELELHLFPQARNIVARTEKSQISINKTKEPQKLANTMSDDNPRQPAEIYSDWIGFRKTGKQQIAADPVANFEKIRAKKEQGLQGMRDKLASLSDEGLRKAGEWLSVNRDLDVPLEFAKFIDPKKTLRTNISEIFEKTKANKKKIEGVEERIRLLEAELKQLSPSSLAKPAPKTPPSPMKNSKGRTKNFENGVAAYIGKSAGDNLNILRKAKAWYWWVHPKDLPGSHAIIAIEKGGKLDSNILKQVALWTLEETLSAKQFKDWQGVKCQFLYTECRFVTPIKGDKLGRVHYKNEKTLTLTVPAL